MIFECNYAIKDLPTMSTFYRELLRACPCKNRPLKFSWKMNCLHFFYTSQATYAMNEQGLYYDRFAFLIFLRTFFGRHPENHTNRKSKPQKLGVTLCLLKHRTFSRSWVRFPPRSKRFLLCLMWFPVSLCWG